MLQSTDNENQFVVEILVNLRKEKFSLLAWIHFLGSSWKKSRSTATANPTLKDSWIYTTIFISVFALSLLVVNLIIEGPVATLRLMPGFLFFVCWQQSDLYWHLGLNRHAHTGTLLPVIGTATILTLLRGLGVSYLLGRSIGGIITSSKLLLLVFLCGIITDILDGQLARRTQTQTKYGQIVDGEADFFLYAATTCILIQQHILPIWFGFFVLLRFTVPLFAAVFSYFIFTHPVQFGSTLWGKAAGMALCFYYLLLLAPGQPLFLTVFLVRPFLILTLLLLTIAPFAQIARNVKDVKFRKR
ncbi:MAG: CDP-alcohol phosphatidyltransferase family protein [Ktedonobacteraceae bacterium]